MNWQRHLQWVWTHPRRLIYAIGGGATISLALFLVTPKVDPFPPSELTVLSEASFQQAEADGSLDFIFRPLFLKDRRPPEPIPDLEAREAPPPVVVVQSLDGVELLGVFASGDNAGIIILREGERQRVYAGEALMGWTLTHVNSRKAIFNNDVGGVAELDLAAVSSLLPLSGAGALATGSPENEAPAPPPGPPVIRALGAASDDSAEPSSGPTPLVTIQRAGQGQKK